jgi:hypothetical protein
MRPRNLLSRATNNKHRATSKARQRKEEEGVILAGLYGVLRDDLVRCYMGAEWKMRNEEKKFIHFDINLLILDHSWLNEINIHTEQCTSIGVFE